MLASLETPLLGENTAAVAIMISHLLMQTGEPLYSLPITCGWGLGTFRGSPQPEPRDLPVSPRPHTHTHPGSRARVLSAPPRCRVTRLLDGQLGQLAVARWVVLLSDWLAD